MAKRLNPHRRLLAKQAALLVAARKVQSANSDADMSRLQQGRVRSSCQPPRVQLTHTVTARPVPWEGRGRSPAKPPKRFGGK